MRRLLTVALVLSSSAFGQAVFRAQNAGPSVPVTCSGYDHWGTITSFPTPGSTLTNFPLLLHATVASLKTTGNSGNVQHTATSNGVTVPADFILKDTDGATPLGNFEVESYDATTGEIWVWVNYPSFTSGSITLYYCDGNSGVSTFQGNVNGTWNSAFKFVTHLNGLTDSTASGNTITNHSTTSTATGTIDGDRSFSGTAQYLSQTQTNFPSSNGARTIEAWVNLTDVTTPYNLIFDHGTNSGTHGYSVYVKPTEAKLHVAGYFDNCGDGVGTDVGSTFTVSVNTWTHLAVTYDGTTATFFKNGVAGGTCLFEITPNTTNTLSFIGTDLDVGDMLHGQEDEVKLTNTSLSADWLAAEVANQASPATLSAATAF